MVASIKNNRLKIIESIITILHSDRKIKFNKCSESETQELFPYYKDLSVKLYVSFKSTDYCILIYDELIDEYTNEVVYNFILATSYDTEQVYEELDFDSLNELSRFLEKINPSLYKETSLIIK